MHSPAARSVVPLIFLVVAVGALSLIGCSSVVRGQMRAPVSLTVAPVPTTIILEGGAVSPGTSSGPSAQPSTESAVTLAEPGTAEPAGGSAPVYVVAQGQTIAAIAALVGVAAEDLAAYNGLAVDEELTEGTVLALPPGLEGER